MSKILFICTTHGDESFSISVLKKLEKTYDKHEYSYDWIIGNPKALKKNVRFIDKDLNRSAPGNLKSSYYEERRAAEIILLAEKYDLVIDIHGTNSQCGVVKVIPFPTPRNIELARAIPLSRNIIWYVESSQTAGPIVQHTEVPAIEIECGPKDSPAVSKKLEETLEQILKSNRTDSLFIDNNEIEQEFYSVYGSIKSKPGPNLKDFELVKEKNESFYPFLSVNQYDGIICYKIKPLKLPISEIVVS